jgi:Protein of unknown function (DUF3325)
MIHVALLLAMLAAFACLCAADPRHQPHLFGARRPAPESRRLRMIGWVLIVGATVAACAVLGIGYGLVEALGFASIGAVVQMSQLCRAIHRRAPAWPWLAARSPVRQAPQHQRARRGDFRVQPVDEPADPHQPPHVAMHHQPEAAA